MPKNSIPLFVYGTLKKDQGGCFLMDGASFLGKTKTVNKYKIFQLKCGLLGLQHGNKSVMGELYQVSPDKLKQLDLYEGRLYTRQEVELENGKKANAYFLNNLSTTHYPKRIGACQKKIPA